MLLITIILAVLTGYTIYRGIMADIHYNWTGEYPYKIHLFPIAQLLAIAFLLSFAALIA